MLRFLLTKGVLPGFSTLNINLAVTKVEITAVVLHKNRDSARENLM